MVRLVLRQSEPRLRVGHTELAVLPRPAKNCSFRSAHCSCNLCLRRVDLACRPAVASHTYFFVVFIIYSSLFWFIPTFGQETNNNKNCTDNKKTPFRQRQVD